MFPSWQAYSYIASFVCLSGTMMVHGFVHVVDRLLEDRPVILGLEDLNVAVVARAEPGRAKADATLRQSAILPGVGFAGKRIPFAPCPTQGFRRCLLPFWRHRRHAAVGWI